MPTFTRGEIFFSEDPFSTVVLDERLQDTCNWCMAYKSPGRITCDACWQATYCSSKCRDKDTVYHGLECLMLQTLPKSDSGLERMVLRTIARVLDDEKSGKKSTGTFFGVERTYDDLVSFSVKMDKSDVEAFRGFSEELEELLASNGINVSKDDIFDAFPKVLRNGHNLYHYELFGKTQLGNALYLGGSKPNHTCEFKPEFLQLFEGTKLMFKALKNFGISDPLKLTVNYISPQHFYTNRQKFLESRYYFSCDCDRCIEESDTPRMDFFDMLDGLLSEPTTSENKFHLRQILSRLARCPNDKLEKSRLHLKILVEDPPTDIGETFSFGMAALEGCKHIPDRMMILAIMCRDLAKAGANRKSHEFHAKFKHCHEMAMTLFIDVHGSDHRLVKEIARFAVPEKAKAAPRATAPPSPLPKETQLVQNVS